MEKKLAEGHTFILGDWMGGSSIQNNVPKSFVAEMHLLKAYDVTALAYRVAGRADHPWEEKRGALRRALAEKYLDASGAAVVAEQTVIAMLLEMGVGENREALARQLVALVEASGYQLCSGMVGIQYIYHALSGIGQGDLAYRLLVESDPGYRSWFEKGETTLWEMWNGENKGSHNHHMFSGVIAWFFRALLGITPCEDAPGFERIELRPCFVGALGFARCSMQTVRGIVEAEWTYENGGFTYTVTVPEGICATYDGKPLTAGTHTFYVKED